MAKLHETGDRTGCRENPCKQSLGIKKGGGGRDVRKTSAKRKRRPGLFADIFYQRVSMYVWALCKTRTEMLQCLGTQSEEVPFSQKNRAKFSGSIQREKRGKRQE